MVVGWHPICPVRWSLCRGLLAVEVVKEVMELAAILTLAAQSVVGDLEDLVLQL